MDAPHQPPVSKEQRAKKVYMKPSEKQNVSFGIIILALIVLLFVSWNSAGAQDDPICVPGEPCIAPAITAIATPTATPVVAPSPEATPVIVRPMPLGPCRIAPGCVLLPIVRAP